MSALGDKVNGYVSAMESAESSTKEEERMNIEPVLTTYEIRNGFGSSFLGDGAEADPEDVRAENLVDFDRWLTAERGRAYQRAASWARRCSGESAHAAAEYIEKLAEIEAKVARQ